MNKNCKLTIGAMLLLTTAFSVTEVRAQTCVVPPTCEGLGYDKAASDCGGLAKLRCPFDDSKYFCTAYTDQNGNKKAEVGDIVYTDAISAEVLPGRIPVGIVFDVSGKMMSIKQFTSTTDPCGSHAVDGISGWRLPTLEEAALIKPNLNIINATLGKISGTTQFKTSSECLSYNADLLWLTSSTSACFAADVSQVTGENRFADYKCTKTANNIRDNFSKGCCRKVSANDCHAVNHAFCVREFSGSGAGEAGKVYQVGDAYVSEDGNVIGVVVEVDGSGQHGTVAMAGGSGTNLEATMACANKSTPGHPWKVATGQHACTLLKNAGSASNWDLTCGIHTSSDAGACVSGTFYSKCMYGSLCNKFYSKCMYGSLCNNKNCTTESSLSYVCETSF